VGLVGNRLQVTATALKLLTMIDPDIIDTLRAQVAACVATDRALLDELVTEIKPLQSKQQRINPRSVTSVALVGTDGGNNELRFDPFLVQVIRIVDSSSNQLWTSAIEVASWWSLSSNGASSGIGERFLH
jgi:hypothetical protein